MAPADFESAGSDLLAQRTNLLSPSVTLLPVFKVTQISATDANLPKCISGVNVFFSGKDFKNLQDLLEDIR
jgi:hypothetical protein